MTRAPLGVLLLVGVALISTFVDADSSRLVERPLRWSTNGALEDVPVVDPPHRIAGYFKLNRTKDAHMFFFFYESRSRRSDDPVVLWMTGGPGCSSEIAILYENGPYNLQHNLTLTDNKWGWDVNANIIFVDQPINTGFSWSDDSADVVSSEHVVSMDMLDFLEEFFDAHPEYANRDLYITGESYAGHYVPAVANHIYRAKELGTGPDLNLAGVAIGNGLTNPTIQFGAYADFAAQNGVISEGTRSSIMWWWPLCRFGTNMCNRYKWTWLCSLTLEVCQATIFQRILMSKPDINVYDIRKTCDGPLCYDFSDAEAFLNSRHVRDALGVGNRKWTECSSDVYGHFLGDFMRDFSSKLLPLLEDNIRVLIYAGDKDLICNWLGNRRWVDALEWSGAAAWTAAEEKPWVVKGRHAGNVTSAGTLTFLKVFDAGHMVPMDQPEAALDMITRFTRNKPLSQQQHQQGVAAHAGLQLVAGQARVGGAAQQVLLS